MLTRLELHPRFGQRLPVFGNSMESCLQWISFFFCDMHRRQGIVFCSQRKTMFFKVFFFSSEVQSY